MIQRIFYILLALALSTLLIADDYIEEFAFSNNRAEVLKKLIPGNEEYYLLHAIYYQQNNEQDKLKKILEDWKVYAPSSENRQLIIERNHFKNYEKDPEAFYHYLKTKLNLSFLHQKNEPTKKQEIPNKPNPELLDSNYIIQNILKNDYGINSLTPMGLYEINFNQLKPNQRHHFLLKIDDANYPNLVKQIAAELKASKSYIYEKYPVSKKLTYLQLEELFQLIPDLHKNTNFIKQYIKTREIDELKGEEKIKNLQEILTFVRKINNFEQISALLYDILDENRKLGQYPEDLFIDYLRHSLVRDYWFLNKKSSYNTTTIENLCKDNRRENKFNLVTDYLFQLLAKEQNTDKFKNLINQDFLNFYFAETKILSNTGDPKDYYQFFSSDYYNQLLKSKELEFLPSNQEHYHTDDLVKINFLVKNISNVKVEIFQLNSKELKDNNIYQISTTGLEPNLTKEISFNHPSHHRHNETIELPELASKGIFLIKLVSDDLFITSFIHKGWYQYAYSPISNGSIFKIFDDKGELLKTASIIYSSRTFHANKDGEIHFPFSTKDEYSQLLMGEGSYFQKKHVNLNQEYYALSFQILNNRESIIRNHSNTIIFEPSLLLNNNSIPLKKLKSFDLIIKQIIRQDNKEVPQEQRFSFDNLGDKKIFQQEYRVHKSAINISFQIESTINLTSRYEEKKLTKQISFPLNIIDNHMAIASCFLQKKKAGFQISILDKNGKLQPYEKINLSFKSTLTNKNITIRLQSNENGKIELPDLKHIESFTTTVQNFTQFWDLEKFEYTPTYHLTTTTAEETLIAYNSFYTNDSKYVRLYQKNNHYFLTDLTNKVSYDGLNLKLAKLPAGSYQLLLLDKSAAIHITVINKIKQEKSIIIDDKHQIIEASLPNFASILVENTEKENILKVSTYPINQENFVSIHSSKFFNDEMITEPLVSFTPKRNYTTSSLKQNSVYFPKNPLSMEEQYILKRNSFGFITGNMLPKPSFLLNGWNIDLDILMELEEDIEVAYKTRNGGGRKRALSKGGGSRASENAKRDEQNFYSNLCVNQDFFIPNHLIPIQEIKEDGSFLLDLNQFSGSNVITLVLSTPIGCRVKRIYLEPHEIMKKDVRHVAIGSKDEVALPLKIKKTLQAKEEFIINKQKTTHYETISSLQKAFDKLESLNNQLNSFNFLRNWNTLTIDEKMKKYGEFACHELNYFIYKKDPEFFKNKIKPTIAMKYHLTFLDNWFLKNDLTPYTQASSWETLNIFEKILLAQKIPALQKKTFNFLKNQMQYLEKNNQLEYDPFAALFTDEIKPKKKAPPAPMPTAETFEINLAEKAESLPQEKNKSIERRKNLDSSKDMLQEQMAQIELEDVDGVLNDELFIKPVEKTKAYAEAYYYKILLSHKTQNLISLNQFWIKLLETNQNEKFIHPDFYLCHQNIAESILALALLDLPFESEKIEIADIDDQIKIKATQPLIFYSLEYNKIPEGDDIGLIPSQIYLDHNEKREFTITGKNQQKLYPSKIYGTRVVVSNTTSKKSKITLQLETPEGSIPVNSNATNSFDIVVMPFSTIQHTYYYYFSEPGNYFHRGASISIDNKLINKAENRYLDVAFEKTEYDKKAWYDIAQQGSIKEVTDFLQTENLFMLDLSYCYHRLRNKSEFDQIIKTLKENLYFDETVFSYGIFHQDLTTTKEYLNHIDFKSHLGGPITSTPLTHQDTLDTDQNLLDFRPIVLPRIIAYRNEYQITNDDLRNMYQVWKTHNIYRKTISEDTRVIQCVYLLLQNRLQEQNELFQKINPQQVTLNIQYDYLKAFNLYEKNQFNEVNAIILKHQDSPHSYWKEAFTELQKNIKEVQHLQNGGNPERLADILKESQININIEKTNLLIKQRYNDEVQIKYYALNLEQYFSKYPFSSENTNSNFIEPNFAEALTTNSKNELSHEIPKELQNKNLQITVAANNKTASIYYYPNHFEYEVSESKGVLRITDKQGKPLPAVYIKVFGKNESESHEFYKDGYTDPRGMFDYISLSTNKVDQMTKFALLILSKEHGAKIIYLNPPAK